MDQLKRLSLKEVQQKELDLLKKIDAFCTENEIVYFLAYGTLIGTIRHGGFIPWDDDIDIIMPRPDYDKFISLKEKFCSSFFNTDIKTFKDKDYYYPFIKVVDINTIARETHIRKKIKTHIWVDVFPLDGVFDDDRKNKILFFKQKIYTRILTSGKILPFRMKGGIIIKILGTMFIPFGIILNHLFNFSSILDKLSRKRSYETSEKVADVCVGYGMSEIIYKNEIFPLIKEKFEDYEFFIPANYHKYLTQLYGDYMKLPSENKRKTHNVEAFES